MGVSQWPRSIYFALVATLVASGCTTTYRVRPPRQATSDTTMCLQRCARRHQQPTGSYASSDDRTDYHHCIAKCPGMARLEGRCEGLSEPCAEVYGAHAGYLWLAIGIVAGLATILAGAMIIDDLNDHPYRGN